MSMRSEVYRFCIKVLLVAVAPEKAVAAATGWICARERYPSGPRLQAR